MAGIIGGYFLFSIDNNNVNSSEKKQSESRVWTQQEELDWSRDCAKMGRKKELCDCMMNELQLLYPRKVDMEEDMKKKSKKFSQGMINAKKSCK